MQRLDTHCKRYSKALGQLKLKKLDHEQETEHRFYLAQSTLFQAYGVFLEEKHDKTTYDSFFNQLISEGAPCEIMICAIAAKIYNAPEKEKMTPLAISNQITQLSQEYETNIDLALQYAVLQYVIYHITDSNEALSWKKIIDTLLKLGANPWFESNLFFKKSYVFPQTSSIKSCYFELKWSDQYRCNAFCYMLLTNKINDDVVGIISQFIKHDMSVSLDYFSILWDRLLCRNITSIFIERPLFKFLETHNPVRIRQLNHENQKSLASTLINGYYRNSNSDFTSANYLDAHFQLNIVYLSLVNELKYSYWDHRDFFRNKSEIQWWLEKYPLQLNQYIHINIDTLIYGIINNPSKYQQSSLFGSLFQDAESSNTKLQQSSSDNLIFLNETFQIDIARYKFEDNRSLLYYDSKNKIRINSFYEKRLRLILKFIENQQPLAKGMSIIIDSIRKRPSNTAFDIYFNLIHDIAPNLLKKSSDNNVEKQIYTALASGLTDNNPLSCYVRRKLNMQHYVCSFFLGTIPNKDKSLSTIYKFTHHPIYHHWATRKIFDFLDNSPFENTQQNKSRQEIYEVKSELPVSRN